MMPPPEPAPAPAGWSVGLRFLVGTFLGYAGIALGITCEFVALFAFAGAAIAGGLSVVPRMIRGDAANAARGAFYGFAALSAASLLSWVAASWVMALAAPAMVIVYLVTVERAWERIAERALRAARSKVLWGGLAASRWSLR